MIRRRSDRSIRTRVARARGSTLLEILISATITVMMVGASLGVFQAGQNAYFRGTIESTLRSEASRVVDAVADELIECGASTVSVAPADANGGPYVTAQRCLGEKASRIAWSKPVTIGCERERTIDDAGTFALVIASGGERRVIASNLAPGSVRISMQGAVATLRVELARATPDKSVVRVAATRRIRLAN